MVLVGSRMGGYVSTVASPQLEVDSLFLMAPAYYLLGYAIQDPAPRATQATISFPLTTAFGLPGNIYAICICWRAITGSTMPYPRSSRILSYFSNRSWRRNNLLSVRACESKLTNTKTSLP